ncbi:MAG: FixH family protein [Aliarcobacter sp.]|jgi:Pyruvate/2-oxoacid:ferredoxin oxidoreductase gamma subunit|nr:FixH family protein [Aliarcobacter sp.]
MKNLFKIFASLLLFVGGLFAQPIEHNGQKDAYDVILISEKSLVVGNNSFIIELSKDGTVITNAKVKLKVFMPEMPGMPYMEFEDKASLVDEKYKVNINLSMAGTWQYHLKFKTKDDVVHTLRGSVNL